jgi:hypothetical protein
MWCPSVSLSVWANAWVGGHAAPDDVLDALMAWAPCHSVTAYDAVAAGRTGLPWPDLDGAGAMSLLQTVRAAAGRRAADNPPGPPISVALPVPGDVRGLAAGTQFAADAVAVGEAVLICGPDGETIGVVPSFDFDDDADPAQAYSLAWSVYAIPPQPPVDHPELGDAEYTLRTAVRSATDALRGLELAGGTENPRALVEEVLEATSHHRAPDHAPERAMRVLATAAHVDAIISVSGGLTPVGAQSSSEALVADGVLRPLVAVVRAARATAISAILRSAWL